MNKLMIGLVVVVALAIGWFILNPGDTFDYVVVVEDEINAIESELAEIEAAVEAGTLTEEEATAAKVNIMTRLDAINNSVNSAQNSKLTAEQKLQLADGLNRLKNALVQYQATLSVIEDSAIDEEVKRRLSNKGRSSNREHIGLAVVDTINTVQEVAEDAIEDFVATLDEEVEEIETAIEEEIEEAMEDETPSDEDISDDTSDTTSDETEAGIEVESETEAETTL